MRSRPQLTQERLRQLLFYDPETGRFIRIVALGGSPVGSVAGSLARDPTDRNRRYCRIWVDGAGYTAHRLAWLWITGSFPANQIDHANLDCFDNRWSNLRLATHSENITNRSTTKGKETPKGVFLRKDKVVPRPWRVIIQKDRRRYNIGHFGTQQEAEAAYATAAANLHGEFARTA